PCILLNPTAVIVTVVPQSPLDGVKPVIETVTVKLDALRVVPPGPVRPILPDVTPLGTTALSWVALTGMSFGDASPLNVTPVTPVRFAPVIVTVVPVAPLVGL